MAERDANGYIRYSREELERIPSFEQRSSPRAPGVAGVTGSTIGAFTGGLLGYSAGPGGALAGLAAGTVIGDQVARATGAGEGGLKALDRALREEEVDRLRNNRP